MKIKAHPLFFVAVLPYALFGNVTGYLLAFFAITIHELSHYLVALIAGAKDLSVVLMPCGAVLSVKGEFPHQGAVLLAGPFSNLVLASFTLSACWLFPELYGYFKNFVTANVLLAALNLLPAYPLDGGRLVRLLFPQKWARALTAACAVLLGAAALAMFFVGFNFSYLLLSLFMLLLLVAPFWGRKNRCALSDPLYRLAKPDEEGRLKPAVIKEGKRVLRLSSSDVFGLLLSYPPDTPLRLVLAGKI